jgi:hypothetical protein
MHALQSVVEGEIDPQMTFFFDKAWFHLQVYINTQNNLYRFLGKICVRLAASGIPSPRSAVMKSVNKVYIFPALN